MKIFAAKNFAKNTFSNFENATKFFLNGALLTTFITQAGALFLAQNEIVVPEFLVDFFAEKFAPEGTKISLGKIKIRQLSIFVAEEISLSNSAGTAPIFSAKNAFAAFSLENFERAIFGDFFPKKLFVDDAEFHCPAPNSVSGTTEKIFTNGRFFFVRERRNVLKIKAAQFRFGNIPIFGDGEFPFWKTKFFLKNQKKSDGNSPAGTTNFLVEISKIAGVFSEAKRNLEHFEESENLSLQIAAEALGNGNAAISASFFCENFYEADFNIRLKNFSAEATEIFDVGNANFLKNPTLKIFLENADFVLGNDFLETWNFSTRNVGIFVPINVSAKNLDEIFPKKISVRAQKISAENFLHGNFEVVSPISEIEFFDEFSLENFRSRTNFLFAGTPFSISAKVAPEAVSVEFSLSPNVEKLLEIPQISAVVPEDVKLLKFHDFLEIHGNAEFAKNGNFRSVNFEANSGAATWKMIEATAIFARGNLTSTSGNGVPEKLKIDLATVRGKTFSTNAKVETELNSDGNYRIQAFGTTETPEAMNDFLGWFWWRIWKNVRRAPAKNPPRFDIDVYGNWSSKSRWEHVYGAIAGEHAIGGKDVFVDKIRLRVVEEPALISAFDMGFEKGENVVSGTLQWHYEFEPQYHFRDFRFAFTGTMPPHDVFQIVGEGLPETFKKFLVREDAGTADVFGRIFYKNGNPDDLHIAVSVDVKNAPGDFEIFGIHGKDFSGKILYEEGVIEVSPFFAKIGNGFVRGEIFVEFPENIDVAGTKVSIDLAARKVTKTELADVFGALKNAMNSSVPANENSAKMESLSELLAKDPGVGEVDLSSIDLDFSGTIILPEIASLKASGAFSLNDPKLFDLHLFGKFSELLNAMKFSLTSFEFTNSASNFDVEVGKIFFPDMRITGESGEIEVSVNYEIESDKIDGSAVFAQKRFTEIPLLGEVVDLVSSSTKLLPIKISGTIKEIDWKFDEILLTGKRNLPGIAPSKKQNSAGTPKK